MTPELEDLIRRAEKYLVQCGICDFGIPSKCTCPPGDPRAIIQELTEFLKGIDARVTTPGQEAFKRVVLNEMMGLCRCGRPKNRQGKVCCRMCGDSYGSHSVLCERRAKP